MMKIRGNIIVRSVAFVVSAELMSTPIAINVASVSRQPPWKHMDVPPMQPKWIALFVWNLFIVREIRFNSYNVVTDFMPPVWSPF
jgi:hypothetical protein